MALHTRSLAMLSTVLIDVVSELFIHSSALSCPTLQVATVVSAVSAMVVTEAVSVATMAAGETLNAFCHP